MAEATRLLEKINAGDAKASEELFPLVYQELRALAASQLRGESSAHTLQPTALVHEAYLRLVRPRTNPSSVDQIPKDVAANPEGPISEDPVSEDPVLGAAYAEIDFDDQAHFFLTAAQAMRHILVDHARRKKRLKRGAQWTRVPIDLNHLTAEPARLESPDYLLSLSEAITELKQTDPTAAELVHLRYFAGLTIAQTAAALGISPRTASRTWNFARAWLFDRISRKET